MSATQPLLQGLLNASLHAVAITLVAAKFAGQTIHRYKRESLDFTRQTVR
jgi:hypothetical protein